MIIGTGTDLCKIDRIAHSLVKFGDRLMLKICAPREQEILNRFPQHKVRRLAQMFAAKEACSKALGTGLSNGVFMKDMITAPDPLGKPTLVLRGGAKKRLDDLTPDGYTAVLHLSLTDEGGLAHAMVIAEALPKAQEPSL